MNGSYQLLVGNRDWMAKNGLQVTDEMDKKMSENENEGQTAVLCAVNGNFSPHIASMLLS